MSWLETAMAPEVWALWGAIALLGAVLALDETSLAQTWLGQPLPTGIVAGLVFGDPLAGLAVGWCMQLVVLGNLPVGSSHTLDATSATLGVLAGALAAGWRSGAESSADVGALVTGGDWQIGLLVVLAAVASSLGGRLVSLQRRAHLAWKLAAYRDIRDGRFEVVERLQRRALAFGAARGAALTLTWALLVALVWPALHRVPDRARDVFALVPMLAVVLAVGNICDRFGWRRAILPVAAVGGLGFALRIWWG